MTEIEIKQLETEGRFSESGLKLFYILLYTPFGLIICILRVILGFLLIIFGNVVPDVDFSRNILSNLFRAVFGIVIHIENDRNKANAKVVISNCISPLDHYVVHMATGCIMSYPSTLPSPLSFALGLKNFGSTHNLEDLKKSIAAYFVEDTTSVLFQPENRITNGKAVLKFKDWPFGFLNEVQPMYLQLRRPIFDISVRTITSSYWSDIFWYLFSPWTVYNVCFLPVVERDDATDTEFAEKVRRDIAAGLQVEACSYSVSDIIDWEKRYLLEKRRARMVHSSMSNTAQSNNPELHRMARQVKEVLPTVPYNVIFKDLARTKNVDITISNILEGHVPYTPEAIPSVSNAATPSSPAVNVPVASTSMQQEPVKDSLCTAASSFPKSAQERMQSFQERKLQLIMNARKRYMDKHGLNALASNDC